MNEHKQSFEEMAIQENQGLRPSGNTDQVQFTMSEAANPSQPSANTANYSKESALEVIDQDVRNNKLGILRLFIREASEDRMEYDEVVERIEQVRNKNFITDEDTIALKRELDEVLGRTPEQIRSAKLGILREFIGLAKTEQMDYEEVIEYISQIRNNNFITEEDVGTIKRELDEALGKTPEQIKNAKFGIIRMFIGFAKDGQMDYEEVLEHIDQVKRNNFISEEDSEGLKKELELALGRTKEQIRDSKLQLLRSFIALHEKGQMDKEEVLEYIRIVSEKGYITPEDTASLHSTLENLKVN